MKFLDNKSTGTQKNRNVGRSGVKKYPFEKLSGKIISHASSHSKFRYKLTTSN